MIPSKDEINRALFGVWLLAKRDRRGMAWLDLTVEGFWKSFFAMAVAAPTFVLLVIDRYLTEGLPGALGLVAVSEAVGYVLGWLAFPIAAIFITRHLGLGARYVPLIVAANWGTVLQITFFMVARLTAGFLPAPVGGVIMVVATFVVLTYQWFVILVALETTPGTAAALVAIDVLLSSLVSLCIEKLLLG